MIFSKSSYRIPFTMTTPGMYSREPITIVGEWDMSPLTYDKFWEIAKIDPTKKDPRILELVHEFLYLWDLKDDEGIYYCHEGLKGLPIDISLGLYINLAGHVFQQKPVKKVWWNPKTW